MERFYERLARGDTSSALRDAKLDLLAKFGDQVSPFLLGGIYRDWRDINTHWNQDAMNLTLDERTKIFDKLCRLVATKHFSPGMNGVDWTALAQGGREIRPPDDLTFSVGDSANLLIEKLHGGQQKVKVQLPMPKSQKHPVTAPEAMHTERLSYEIGLLKVAMFPGAIGIAVAKDIDLRNRCTRRMQPTHGGSARQHRWRNWRAAPDELSHAWKTRSGLQPHAGTP